MAIRYIVHRTNQLADMAQNRGRRLETETDELIEAFLRRDLVSADAERRAERLRSNENAPEALEVILEDRKRRRVESATSRRRPAE